MTREKKKKEKRGINNFFILQHFLFYQMASLLNLMYIHINEEEINNLVYNDCQHLRHSSHILIVLRNYLKSNSSHSKAIRRRPYRHTKVSTGDQEKLFIPIIVLFKDSVDVDDDDDDDDNDPSMGGTEDESGN